VRVAARLTRSVADAVAALGEVRGGGRGWLLLSVAAGWFSILGMRFLVPAVLPGIRAEFAVSRGAAGLAVTAIWACYGLVQFPAGVLIDRLGERTLLVVGVTVGALGIALLALSPLFAAFLVGCVLFGFGTGFYGPARGTVLSNTFTRRAGVAFGVTLAMGSVGSALFPLVSGLVVDRLGWRAAVGAGAPLLLLVGGMLYRSVPPGISGSTTTDLATVRADLGPAVRDPAVAVSAAAVTFMLFAFQGLTAFLPTYLIEAKGLTQSTASALFALMFLSGAGFQLLGGSAADRYGSRAVLVAAAAVGALTLAALPVVSGFLPLVALAVALGSRMALVPVNNAYILAALPNEVQGAAWGLVRTSFFLVGATGSTAVGVLADAGLFGGAFLLLAALNAVAAGLYLYLPDDPEP